MRDKHYEPGSNLRKDLDVCLTGAGHLYDAKTAQPEITERFIGTELPNLGVPQLAIRGSNDSYR